jgi:SAM-dependent methyltransferase
MPDLDSARQKTIDDFGDQWTRYQENDGYYASAELFNDIVTPFLSSRDLEGLACLDIGAGTGRISAMMLNAGARHVTAVEPSRAYDVLRRNLAPFGSRATCLLLRGDEVPAGDFDIAVSIGVLHHIPDPSPVVNAARGALRDGGRILIWLYGAEGNGLYRLLLEPVRLVTRRLPVRANEAIAHGLYGILTLYGALTKRLPFLPLARYLDQVFFRFSRETCIVVIVDQLNPQWAEYYTQERAERLLSENGFADVRSHHRHGYSWTVTGVKRAATPAPRVSSQ